MDSKIDVKLVKCSKCKKIISIYISKSYQDFVYCDECYDLYCN